MTDKIYSELAVYEDAISTFDKIVEKSKGVISLQSEGKITDAEFGQELDDIREALTHVAPILAIGCKLYVEATKDYLKTMEN